MSKLLVTLVHLSIGDPPLQIDLQKFLNSQPSISVLSTPVSSESPEQCAELSDTSQHRYINASESIIQTVLSILSKRDLINEQSSKYLIQYFQFFNMYASIGIQQCFHLIRSQVPLALMQFALDELQMTNSNVNIFATSSQLSGSSSFNLSYAKMSNNQNMSNSSSQYADLTKLFCVVATLLRCFDVSSYCSSSVQVRTNNI